ncbi:MAG: SPFH domain-containing protein [Elusimicrobiota bacterium]|nr:SPFH domain-containing protein [Elusimicrobiota bacterium]
MGLFEGMVAGVLAWLFFRVVVTGLYTVDQNERAVKTSFGRAQRIPGASTLQDQELASTLSDDEKLRYDWPQLRVIPPGGPYFKWPWEKVHKVSVAVQSLNLAFDPETPSANQGGTVLDAVTMDQLNTGLTGQIRFRVSERNLYAYLFGIKHPIVHVMGYFVSVLREKIAVFDTPGNDTTGVSINHIRKNLRQLNDQMDQDARSSTARFGITLDASLITSIDPPREVDSALAAINTAHNHVSSEISVAQAAADQKITQSKRAVEIETLKAQAEVEPLVALAKQLTGLKAAGGSTALLAYLRNVKLGLYGQTDNVVLETATHEGR